MVAIAVAPPVDIGVPAPASTDTLVDVRAIAPGRRRRVVPRPLRRMAGPLLLLGLWQLASALGWLDPRTLAPPSDVARAGWELARSGELSHHLLASLRRVSIGLALGTTVGLVLASLAGLSRLGEDLIDSSVQVLRSIPILGLVGLFIIWFGIGEEPKILLVALATTFPIYLNTYAAIRGVDAKLVEAATTFGLRGFGLVRHVILPGAVPGFLVGLRYALTGSWLVMIVAEQINARSGLGYLINEARSWFRTDIIVLALVIYGVLGLVADGFVRLLERHLLAWRRGFEGR